MSKVCSADESGYVCKTVKELREELAALKAAAGKAAAYPFNVSRAQLMDALAELRELLK